MNREEKLNKLFLLYAAYRRRNNGRRRRFYSNPLNSPYQRIAQGDFDNLVQEMKLSDTKKYFNHLRMSPMQFENLLAIVGPKINKQHIVQEFTLSPSLKLCVTLRYLASGDLMVSIARQFRIGESTTSSIIRSTCLAIWETLSTIVFLQPNYLQWNKIIKAFEEKWQFPHCLGALDGKHIAIVAPAFAGSTYYNYKQFHSTVLMAMCDANYCFTLLDIGAQGRQSDGGIFKNSVMGQKFENNLMRIPPASRISEDGPVLPNVIVADAAFALTSYSLRPYPGRELNNEKRVFNYRLSRARRCIENAFGIMAAKWRIFRKPIQCSLVTLDSIVQATTCLHNYLKRLETHQSKKFYCTDAFEDRLDNAGNIILGEWRNFENNAFIDNPVGGQINAYARNASQMRDQFRDYFNNEGAVPFQWNRI